MPDFLAETLTWPNNYYNLIAVSTAVDMSLPPTSFLTNKEPSAGWSREDKKLAMAMTILNRETCSICGNPLWICRSSNSNLIFKARKDICYADAERKKAADKRQNKNLKPGEYIYVVPEMLNESDLPTRRDYLRELNED